MDRDITLVCGPPCAGKSTFVQENMQPGDLVVDYDTFAQQHGSPRTHNHAFKYHRQVQADIRSAYAAIEAGQVQRAWVISSQPNHGERQQLAARLGARVVVIDADDTDLLKRAQSRPDPQKTARGILEWRAIDRQTGPVSHL